ncbi:type VII secretion protein EccB [Saccharothrix longispora]|uniref:Type VII secretion protein EccB n=1 Tax=Saccharothrix longispora TaxID=33920 RepID=A0ABU1PS32_9PSEU|nr:type VII secretion protein EccB [Saccharothrix longispora]MDR6593460.1 type VII secretion protein EccB [Saccharothrix longispora]
MQTQRDHLHAYQTMVGRMSSALLLGDTSHGEPPAKRALFGLVMGIVLALLIGVGFGVYGLIKPGGSQAWKQPGAILVEEETGATYVHRGGVLVPVSNHASALLLVGEGAHVETIKRVSLAGLERGPEVGIEGAPDAVPDRAALVTGPWLLCLAKSGGGMGLDLVPGAQAADAGDDSHLWVASAGRQYLLWGNRKHRLADDTVPVALGLGTGPPVAAPPAWLDALPDGPVIGAADVADDGKGGPSVAGAPRRIGDLFEQATAGGGTQHFVLREDGLAPLSRIESVLVQAKLRRGVSPLDTAALAAAPRSADTSLVSRLPALDRTTSLLDGDGPERAVCLRQRPEGARVVSELVTADPGHSPAQATGTTAAVRLKPSSGVLAAAVPVADGRKPDRFLITDRGVKYSLPDDGSVAALGFGGIAPTPVAADVLAAVPTGPALARSALGVVEKRGS